MSAVESRLAATLAKHIYNEWAVGDDYCSCGATVTDAEYLAHLAAAITAADDLAVVELPKPDDKEGAVWRLDPAAKPGYPDGSYVRTRHWPAGTRIGAHGVSDMRVPDAERAAAALLAAAKAAEAVDRGEQ